MSYILDALKKSDQQRQRGATPTLLAAQATPTAPRRPRYFLNSMLAAVLICAGIVVGWLRPWQTKQPAPAAESIASMPVSAIQIATPASVSVDPELIGESEQEPLMHQSTSATQSARLSAGLATKRDSPAPAHNASPVPLSRPDTGIQQAAGMSLPDQTTLGGTVAEEGKSVMALNELPPSIQREIPAITLSFHAYSSNPKERRVMINGNIVGQGEQLAPGLSVEQITPDGVILGYKGYRFQRGVR
jgi:general secretion pathway protein B